MAFDTAVRRGHPVIFGLIIFFAIIEGAIATWLIVRFNQHHNTTNTIHTRTAFLTFVSWWTVFFSLWYFVLFLHAPVGGSVLTSVGSHLLFLFITWVFWTAGAAAITAALGGGNNCSTIDFELVYCNQLNAVEGFAWATWIFVTIALVVVMVRGVSANRRGDGMRGGLV